jgi:hypothetical protein
MDMVAIAKKIIDDSDKLRKHYKDEYLGDPDAELLVWLQIAVQREAMVSYLYDKDRRDERLAGATGEVVEVARDVMTLIWQQESSHTAELAARIVDGVFRRPGGSGAFDAAFSKAHGTLDAAMLNHLTNAEGGILSALARAATWLAACFAPKMVPPFATELSHANLRDYFVLATALEKTAKDSYDRIGELVEEISAKSGSLQPLALRKPIRNVHLDEKFHESVFREMESWLDGEGQFLPGLDAPTCMQKLKALLLTTVGIQRYAGASNDVPVLPTAGGLEKLFAKHEIKIQVEKAVAAA